MSKWNLVRLELARTAEFPDGSASRAYMLRVPLDGAGLIDEAAVAHRPSLASVRRFWPSQADQTGHLVRNGRGWAFSHTVGDEGDEKIYRLEGRPLRIGEYLTITEPDGSRYPFRVVSSQADGVSGV
jgi:hypothetical protein